MKTNWRKQLIEIFRWPGLAVGAAVTGVSGVNASMDETDGIRKWEGAMLDSVILPNTLNATATDRYAAHRSHRSHGSHRSHRSSSGGGYSPRPSPTPQTSPPPVTSPPATITPSPRAQPSTPSGAPKPTPQDLSMMTVRVQAALMRAGYYKGDIDGLLGPETRAALKSYQGAQGLSRTGRMDIDTLTRLGISVP